MGVESHRYMMRLKRRDQSMSRSFAPACLQAIGRHGEPAPFIFSRLTVAFLAFITTACLQELVYT